MVKKKLTNCRTFFAATVMQTQQCFHLCPCFPVFDTILLHSLLYAAIPIFKTSSGPWQNKTYFIIMPSYLIHGLVIINSFIFQNISENNGFFNHWFIDIFISMKSNFNERLALNLKIRNCFQVSPWMKIKLKYRNWENAFA